MLKVLLLILATYVLGSIPTGFWLVKLVKGVDIRDYGSGNIGTTNVKRVMGGRWAVAVMLFDMLKGLLPVMATRMLLPDMPWVAVAVGIAAIVGHSRSCFLNFQGGKSAATGWGTILGVAPTPSLILTVIGVFTFYQTRTVSIAAITVCILCPILFIVFGEPFAYIVYGLLSSGYVIFLHRSNIQRLLSGSEHKI